MAIGQLFVYGSLMKDFFNYDKYLEGKVLKIEEAYIKGTLYHLENKGFPGYIPVGDDTVYGEIMTITDYEMVMDQLDKLEGYKPEKHVSNMYNRRSIEVVSLVDNQSYLLDVYVYNKAAECNDQDDRRYLEKGSWRHYMQG